MPDPVMVELKRRLAQSDTIDVSRHQFVNMDRVRTAAGELWPSLRERVFLATRSIIERRVAEADLIIPCATGFLVVFAALSGEPAARLTARIRQDMERFFLGDGDLAELSVESASERLSIEEFRAALAAADVAEDAPSGRAPAPPAPGERDAIALADVAYEAAWDVRREAVASFMARPRTVAERDRGWRPDLGAQLRRAEDRLQFDLAVMKAVAAEVQGLLERGVRCAVILPAGYVSLVHPRTRSAYVTAYAGLPVEQRQLIWIGLDGAPPDAPAATLTETGRIILTHAPHLFLTAPLGAASFERYAQTGAGWIGARLPAHFTDATRLAMDSFLAKARRARTRVFFSGCDDWETARAASRRGADLILGRAAGVFDAPTAPFRLSRNKLLTRAA